MENKHLGVTFSLFLLISGFSPIAGINFVNETSSTVSIGLVNTTVLTSDVELTTESSITKTLSELGVEFKVTEASDFVLPNECSSGYKVINYALIK